MKFALYLCLAAASHLSAEYVFFPGTPELRNIKLEIPGYIFDKNDALTIVPEGDSDTVSVHKPLEETQARASAKLGFAAAAASFAAIGRAAPSIVTFQSDTSISAAAPLCLACTCKLGRTSCKDAGGVAYWSSGEPLVFNANSTKCTGNGCVIEAPSTMSACDPLCKKRSDTCSPTLADLTKLKCSDNVDTSFCNTDCQYRAAGEKVVCNQQAIATGVMNDIPLDVCNAFLGRKRRDAGQGRFLSSSFLGRFVPSPASTVRVPGAALLSYAPTGRCIPQEIANAPLCTKLD